MSEAYYIHWGVVQISLTNLLIIVAMVIVFVAAVTLRMPSSHDRTPDQPRHREEHHEQH
jgi:hypothetical protein